MQSNRKQANKQTNKIGGGGREEEQKKDYEKTSTNRRIRIINITTFSFQN